MEGYRLMRWMGLATVAVFLSASTSVAQGHLKQTRSESTAGASAPAVLLSDLHFDPLYDPAKFTRLRSSPATDWQEIFGSPATPTQMQDWLKLNAACKLTRGRDTSWPLLESSLAAAGKASPHARFVTVSGDLLAHEFDCRYRILAPKASETEIAAFAEKTISYVAAELHRTFPQTPVYVALGNNDSGCGDYKESEHSEFLRSVAGSLGADVISAADKQALTAFSAQGDYSVALPRPIERGRLIVLQNLFQSRLYKDCNGDANPKATAAQLEWLRTELTAARARHEQVWIMAHIPPGVDVYNTFTAKRDVCAGDAPVMFLGNDRMVDVLEEFADVVRMAIFAHTHLDEMKLLRGKIAAKLVPAISPINGNLPAFTLAEIDDRTAALRDYRVIAGDNQTGAETKWAEEYSFSTLYRQKAYGPVEVGSLLKGFLADHDGVAQASTDYQQNALAGGGKGSLALHFLWTAYSCEMGNDTEKSYRACVCRNSAAETSK